MQVKYQNGECGVIDGIECADAVLVVQIGEPTPSITKAVNYARTGPHRGAGGIPWRPLYHFTSAQQLKDVRSFLAIRRPAALLVVGANESDPIMKDIFA